MARDGSGNYSRVEGPYVNGVIADADEVNNELDDIGSALTTSINTSGTKAFAANQPMGGFKLTGLAAGSAAGDSLRYEQLVGAYQPLDALLTAIAALTTADDRMLDFTGVDTVAVVTYATVLSNISALNQTAGDVRYAQLAAANVFTLNQTISKNDPVLYMIDTTSGGSGIFYTNESDIHKWGRTGVAYDMTLSSTVFEVGTADTRIAAAPTTLATNSAGFRGLPQNIQDANYTAVLGDSGGHLYHTSATPHTHTIPANASVAYPIGHTLTFINRGSGAVTIAITTDTLNWRGSTGSRTLAQYGRATAVKITATAWDIDGNAYLS